MSSRLLGVPILRTVYSVPCNSENPPLVLLPNDFSACATWSSVTPSWRISTGLGVKR